MERKQVKNRDTEKKKGFGDIVYIDYQCLAVDDEVEEECSRVCFYGESKKRNT